MGDNGDFVGSSHPSNSENNIGLLKHLTSNSEIQQVSGNYINTKLYIFFNV